MEALKSIVEETLDSTITYLEGIPTTVAIPYAIRNIKDWENKIKEAENPKLTPVQEELANLGKVLGVEPLNTKDVATSLKSLGEKTRQASGEFEGAMNKKLDTLSGWLIKVGETLLKN